MVEPPEQRVKLAGRTLPYDPMQDFVVISRIAQVSFMVLAHPDVPAKNLPELIAYAKANPDKLAVATDGARRFSGMIAAWLNKLAGTQMSYVPYTQMTQGIQDAIAGRVQLVIIAMPTAKPHAAAGKLKALAVTSRERLPEFPDVQAVAETFPGFDFPGWWVLAAPTGVPGEIVTRVNREMSVILNDPEVVGRMSNMGFASTRGGTIKDVSDYIQVQHKAWGTLVKEIGLQPE
jgi:tripartite-type tricarboxylate transporter receptor subunit TctC